MINRKRRVRREKSLSMAPAEGVPEILNAGTGPGFFAINLALAVRSVTGVDGAEAMLCRARENAAAHGAACGRACSRWRNFER